MKKLTIKLIASTVIVSMITACAPTGTFPPRDAAKSRQSDAWAGPIPGIHQLPGNAILGGGNEPAASADDLFGQNGQTIQQGGGKEAVQMLTGRGTGLIKSKAESLLSNFGTAEVSLGGLGSGRDISGSVDLLVPFYDEGSSLAFAQLGARKANTYTDSYRTTLNAGLGYRHFIDDRYMLGGNVFFDQDITVGHQRIGIGGEYWMDNLKLAANGYFPMSDWKKSPDLERYLERPATGFDVRAEGFLPFYPALGGNVMYEQYFGDEVGLFGPQNRQKNPKAFTVGLTYQPVPALSFNVNHKMGQDGMKTTNGKLTFKYQIGVPWHKQLDPSLVGPSRKLEAMRHDLVQRNNEIVLEYKKDEDRASVKLPESIVGYPGAKISFPIAITGIGAAAEITYEGTAAPFADPYVVGSSMGWLTLPAYDEAGTNHYTITASGINEAGQKVSSNPMTVVVQAIGVTLKASKPQAMADGSETVQFTAELRGAKGEPMVKHPVSWNVPEEVNVVSQDKETNDKGIAETVLSSLNAGKAIVVAVDSFGFKGEANTVFIGDPTKARVVSIVATPPIVVANGSDTAAVTATLTDDKGRPVGANIDVTFTGPSGSMGTVKTNVDSQASITVGPFTVPSGTGIEYGAAVVGQTPPVTTSIQVPVDLSGAVVSEISVSPGEILANGAETSTFSAKVLDANGNEVGANALVTWSGDISGTTLTGPDSIAKLVAPARTVPGKVTVKASAGTEDIGKSAELVYKQDLSTVKVSDLVASSTTLLANGVDTSTLTATVTDAWGNAVGEGVEVQWSGDITGTSTTDAASKASIVIAARTSPGELNIAVKASASDPGKSEKITFNMDMSGIKVSSLIVSPDTILANGSDTATITVVVTDAFGNRVGAGVPVTLYGKGKRVIGGEVEDVIEDTATINTDADGELKVTVSPEKVPSTLEIHASVSDTDPGKTALLTFVLDVANLQVTNVSATDEGKLANGVDTYQIVAAVADAFGQPVGAGITVSWGGDLSGTSVTNADSQAVFTVPATTTPKFVTLTAKAAPGDAGKSITVAYAQDLSNTVVASLSAADSVVSLNSGASTFLTAAVQDAFGNPVGAGVPVTWTITYDADSGGSTGPQTYETLTDASGVTVLETPSVTDYGRMDVHAKASSSDAGKSVSIQFVLDVSLIRVGSLVASPTEILANYSDTATLTATVIDTFGRPVGAGIEVKFYNDGLYKTAMTDADGSARVESRPSKVAGTDLYMATVGLPDDPGKEVTVTVKLDLSQARVESLVATPATVLANGSDTSTVTATVEDAWGNPVGEGVVVTFSGDVSGTAQTDASGKARITVPARTVPQEVSVSATASPTDPGKEATVSFSMDLSTIKVESLVASKTSLLANGAETSQLVAQVVDAWGNLAPAGVTVTFSDDVDATSVTDGAGKASLIVPGRTTPGTISITAKAQPSDAGKTVALSYGIDMSTIRVDSLVASPASILANGSDTSAFIATVTDAWGNPVAAGVPVTFTGDLNGVEVTDGSGQATLAVPARTIQGTVSVLARAISGDSGKTATVTYEIDMSTIAVESLTVSDDTLLANGADSAVVTATVKDAWGNLVGSGVTVTFSGGITGTPTTDSSGKATLNTPTRTVPGTINVLAKANDSDPGKSVVVTYEMDMSSIKVTSLVADPASIVANGTATTTITATVTDGWGNAVGAGIPVSWSTDLGTFVAQDAATNDSGKAVATLQAGAVVGTATVHAIVNEMDRAATVEFKPNSETRGDGNNQWALGAASIGPGRWACKFTIVWDGIVQQEGSFGVSNTSPSDCQGLVGNLPGYIDLGGYRYMRGAPLSGNSYVIIRTPLN